MPLSFEQLVFGRHTLLAISGLYWVSQLYLNTFLNSSGGHISEPIFKIRSFRGRWNSYASFASLLIKFGRLVRLPGLDEVGRSKNDLRKKIFSKNSREKKVLRSFRASIDMQESDAKTRFSEKFFRPL